MPRDNRCMYMAHVCCVGAVVKDIIVFGAMRVSFCLPQPVTVSVFICSGLCACTEMNVYAVCEF